MNIARKALIGLASLLCVTAVSLLVYTLTLQTTIMDRTVVKNWLVESKIYDGKLVTALVDSTTRPEGQQAEGQPADAIAPKADAVKTALGATFTPDFIQSQAERTIDSAYDFAEGKTTSFTFSIPINQKRDTIIQQLTKAVEPQIAALPICDAALVAAQSACRPADESVAHLAERLTTENIDKSKLFNEPLTAESMNKNRQQPAAQPVNPNKPFEQLPAVFSIVNLIRTISIIVIIVCAALIFFVTVSDKRIQAISRLSKRIFFGTIITFILAIIVVFIGTSSDFGTSGMLPGQIGGIVGPLIQQIITGVAKQLALFSGIVCAVTLAGWIGFNIWREKMLGQSTIIAVTSAEKPEPDHAHKHGDSSSLHDKLK